MATISRSAFRAGRVIVPDAKWTGEEPMWKGWESWPIEKFMSERLRMLRFYGYYLAQSDLKPAVLAYMKAKGYSKEDIELIRVANPNVVPLTVGKLIRAIDQGMPSLHPDAQDYFDNLPFSDPDNPPVAKDDHTVIRKDLRETIDFLKKEKSAEIGETETKAKPTVNIQDRLKNKVESEVIVHLDAMLDAWAVKYTATKVEPISLISFIRDGGIPAAGCKYISDWLNKLLEEFRHAYNKTDPDCVEGYAHMTRPAIKNRISVLEGMLEEVSKFNSVAKASRKPRVKKTKDATKQVSRLKYQHDSNDYSITSINPTRIPLSQSLFVFNTKYRTLGVYHASGPAGFEIKGTSIKGFDSGTSFITTLRKPKETLEAITSLTQKQLAKYMTGLKCKMRKANGRINPQTLLLRNFENRL
jgi:hypothetical protein